MGNNILLRVWALKSEYQDLLVNQALSFDVVY